MRALTLALRGDWLVETANARWQDQNPGFACGVWFTPSDPISKKPGLTVDFDMFHSLCRDMARRYLSFIERNWDILDAGALDEIALEMLEAAAEFGDRVPNCEVACDYCRGAAALKEAARGDCSAARVP